MTTEHICRFCGKIYIRKKAYTQHILMCEISNQRKNNDKNTDSEKNIIDIHVPSNKELYQIIINLNDKYERLREDYDILKRYVDTRRRKIDILEWLNNNCILDIGNDFTSIFMNMQLSMKHLNMVFENDYINGIADILSQLGDCLRAFTHRDGIFYIYDKNINSTTNNNNNITWRIMENSEFDRLIRTIDNKLLFMFKEWHLKTEKTIDEDKFSELYIKNLKKIMGGNFKSYEKTNKIKNRLYKSIKMEIKNIIVYEF